VQKKNRSDQIFLWFTMSRRAPLNVGTSYPK
jgi:hypothetical protein